MTDQSWLQSQCKLRWPVAEVPGSKGEDDDIDPLDEILEPGEEVPDFSEVGAASHIASILRNLHSALSHLLLTCVATSVGAFFGYETK